MLVHLAHYRHPRFRPWPERAHRRSDPELASLAVVCGWSLLGLTISLLILISGSG